MRREFTTLFELRQRRTLRPGDRLFVFGLATTKVREESLLFVLKGGYRRLSSLAVFSLEHLNDISLRHVISILSDHLHRQAREHISLLLSKSESRTVIHIVFPRVSNDDLEAGFTARFDGAPSIFVVSNIARVFHIKAVGAHRKGIRPVVDELEAFEYCRTKGVGISIVTSGHRAKDGEDGLCYILHNAWLEVFLRA